MESESVTHLLALARAGDAAAGDRVYALIYDRLRVAARQQLHRHRGQQTLHTTVLVNEAWLKLAGANVDVREREHYFALAALAMRRIVVDQARRTLAEKRGGHEIRVTLNEGVAQAEVNDTELLALDTALDRLAQVEPRLAQVVEWRYFGGMSELEIAAAMGVTERTVRRDWRKARAFLYSEMAEAGT